MNEKHEFPARDTSLDVLVLKVPSIQKRIKVLRNCGAAWLASGNKVLSDYCDGAASELELMLKHDGDAPDLPDLKHPHPLQPRN